MGKRSVVCNHPSINAENHNEKSYSEGNQVPHNDN